MPSYVAVDLGAESGRVLRGTLVDGRLTVAEVHRFANRPVQLPTGLHWNVLGLYDGVTAGLAAAAAAGPVDGIGVDAWGNDFGLLDRDGHLVGNQSVATTTTRKETNATMTSAAAVGPPGARTLHHDEP